jgi:hypothetical protein
MKLGASLAVFVLLLGSDALAGPPPGPASDEASAVVASATSPAQSSKPLDKSATAAAQEQLTKLLVKKSVTSRIDFPGYKAGIDLSPAGMWSPHDAAQSIEEHGIGVKKGDQATITAIKLHDEYMEIHLDGGGAGVFAQGFGPDRSRALDKVEGGSRINLRFDRRITHGDVQDLGRIISFLEPVVDTGEIQRTTDMASTLAPAKTEAPAPIVAEASTFGAPLLDPVPQTKPEPAPTKTKSKSGVAPIESKAAEIPSVPTPAPAAPIAIATPIPAAAAAVAPIATAAAATKTTPKTVAATKVEIGMDRMTVFQLLGQPGYKRVDVSKEVPIERWQYDLPANGKRIITFENGKVLRVEDF